MNIPKFDLFVEWGEPDHCLIKGGPLTACQARGLQALTYGIFVLLPNGTYEWRKPTSAVIRPVEEETNG